MRSPIVELSDYKEQRCTTYFNRENIEPDSPPAVPPRKKGARPLVGESNKKASYGEKRYCRLCDQMKPTAEFESLTNPGRINNTCQFHQKQSARYQSAVATQEAQSCHSGGVLAGRKASQKVMENRTIEAEQNARKNAKIAKSQAKKTKKMLSL